MRNRAGVTMAAETNLGLRRSRNEDCFCCFVPPRRTSALAIVADGVGGHSNGAMASLICCRDLAEAYYKVGDDAIIRPPTASAFLYESIRQINRKMFGRNFFDRVPRPMSSTIIAALYLPETVIFASAGDSRLYEFHPDDGLVQLSSDHSFSAEYAKTHGCPPPGAERMRNLIVRAVGPRSELEPEIHIMPRRIASRYMLCSDGVSGIVSAEEIAGIMADSATPRVAVDSILRQALLHGAHDNVTAVVVFPDFDKG